MVDNRSALERVRERTARDTLRNLAERRRVIRTGSTGIVVVEVHIGDDEPCK